MFERKCDFCGKKIEGTPVSRYDATFCNRKHVADYFGTYIEETWNEVYWSDFY